MRNALSLFVAGAILLGGPATAATWTNAESATAMKTEKGVRVYRGATPVAALDGAERSVESEKPTSICVPAHRHRLGYPARRLTSHGFLGVKRYYTALGQRSFN
jgi:hypothetical protein